VTDRTVAVRSLRHTRADGIPPPAAPVVDSEGVESTASIDNGPPPLTTPSQLPHNVDVDPGTYAPAHDDVSFALDNLLGDPVAACRAMSRYREDMPARALNVDLTPDIARRFDEQCRALRIKKKDVIELLLRGWLTHLDHQNLDTSP
jgi:hypothetical protein